MKAPHEGLTKDQGAHGAPSSKKAERCQGEEKPMPMRRYAVAVLAALCAAVFVGSAEARELTYGSWMPPRDAFNTKTLPAVFEQIKQDTKGGDHLEADRRRCAARCARDRARRQGRSRRCRPRHRALRAQPAACHQPDLQHAGVGRRRGGGDRGCGGDRDPQLPGMPRRAQGAERPAARTASPRRPTCRCAATT